MFARAPETDVQSSLVEAIIAASGTSVTGGQRERVEASVRDSASHEARALLAALDGRRVSPGPSGAPSRGRADVLPTGRNLTTIDPRSIPTRTATTIGLRAADEVVRRYLQDHGDYPRALVIDLWASASLRTGGDDLAQALGYLGARPIWETSSNRVTGVEVRVRNGTQPLKGDRGIFLGTGGYESNPEFVRAYQSFPDSAPHHPPTQTGDGLLMAGELGAFIRNIPASLSSMVGYWIPRDGGEPEFHSAGIQELAYPHAIVVNSEGKRFGNEAFFQEFVVKLREFDVVKKHRYANIPFFLLFDSQFRERYPFANIPPGRPLPAWVKRADSLADLAQQLGIDATQLQQTVARFNDNASAGLDPDFGRGQSLWIRKAGDTKHPINPNLGPLFKAPFYGVELKPTESSSAGLYTDIHGRVMHLRGHAISNLYAGGTVRVRTEYGAGYQAGLTLLGGMTFGRMAVEHALLANKKPS